MFAGLKKKLQEEGGSNIVAGGERKSAASNFGATPKDLQTSYIHGEGHGTVHKHNGAECTTNNHGDGNKSHVQAEDGIADINGSREEIIDLLTKRTKQVKTMEARLLELTSLLKEKNQMIEKLETALEKQQDVLCQRVQELNEQYNNCRIKAAETVAVAVRKKEEEMKLMFREIEQRNAQLEQLCKEQKVPHGNVEEQNGYTVEEFSHLKNLLLTTQHELQLLKSQKGESVRLSSVDGSSVEEVTRLTSARLKLESDNQELNETVDKLKSQLKELQDKVQEVTTHSNMSQGDWLEKQIESENCISSLEDSVRSLKAELAQRDAEKSTFLKQLGDRADELSSVKSTLKAEQDRAKQLQVTVDSHEAVTTCLQQRCQQSDSDCQDLKTRLSQVTAELDECRCTLKACRDEYSSTVEKNKDTIASLNETISQLTEEVASLQQQISKLEEIRVEETAAVEADTTARFRKELTALEDQIQDKNRVIKKQEQRLTDLKKLVQRELRVQPPADDVASAINSTTVKAAKPLDVTLPADTDGLHLDVSVAAAAAAAAASVHTSAVHSPPGVGELDPSSPATLTVHEVGSRFLHLNSHFDHAAVLSPSGSSSASQWPTTHEKASNRTRRSSAHRSGTTATSCSSSGGTMMSPVDCEYDFMRELNFKYLRHVVLKFMLSREAEALQLIKAISMLLHFTPEEQKLIRDTLEWKKSWFGPRPQLPTHGQLAKVVPPSL